MKRFLNLDIRQKLTLVIVLTATLVLLLAIAGILVLQFYQLKRAAENTTETIASMVAFSSTPALEFVDVKSAEEALLPLQAEETVKSAIIYDADGRVFATYLRDSDTEAVPRSHVAEPGLYWHLSHLELIKPIISKNDFFGTLFVRMDLSQLWSTLRQVIAVGVAVFLILMLLAITIASQLQKVFSKPLLHLVELSKRVSEEGDYSYRAAKENEDEIGMLVDSFNEMLTHIEQNNNELARHREILEEEVKLRTAELRDGQAWTKAILDTAPDGIISLDQQGVIISCNRSAATVFGCNESDLVLETLFDYIESGPKEEFEKVIREGGPKGQRPNFRSFKFVMRKMDGSSFPASISWSEVQQKDRSLYTVSIRDISEFKEAEEALRRGKEQAEAASRSKSEFLANMSHEIRTPMNGIIGMTGLALETNLTLVQRDYLNTVQESAISLLTILNDILDFSKIEAGQLEVERVEFNLRELVEKIVKAVLGRFADNKNVELLCQIHPDTPDALIGDPVRIRQILLNLIGNAEKFTERGRVILRIASEKVAENRHNFIFEVEDTGIGIEAAKLPIIFDSFSQADASTTRFFGGTGLGLSISSKLVQLMNGQIEAKSVLGEGSTFTLKLPLDLQVGVGKQIIPAGIEDLNNLSVLIVDDNSTSRLILEEMLSKYVKMRTSVAANGLEALEMFKRAVEGGEPFDLVITDFNMPDLSGIELVKRLNSDYESHQTPIVMLSSADRHDRTKHIRDLGVSAYLVKPVLPNSLLSALREIFGKTEPSLEGIRTAVIAEFNKQQIRRKHERYNILVVEDNLVNQRLVKKLLEKIGHSVLIAGNGREALDVLQQHGHFSDAGAVEDLIDLVLMDIQMPVMGGMEATRIIRSREAAFNRHIPIVALTAHALKGHREEYLSAGMDEYLTKPIDANQLYEQVSMLVEREEEAEAAADDYSSEDSEVDAITMAERVDWDINLLLEIVTELFKVLEQERKELRLAEKTPERSLYSPEQIIDVMKLISLVDGEVPLLVEMVREFCVAYSDKLSSLRQAVEKEELDETARIAAFFKAKLGDLCCYIASSEAQKLEEAAHAGDRDKISQCLKFFESEVDLILPALKTLLKIRKRKNLEDSDHLMK
jgi:PAS domain S-box-containing protein